MRKCSVPANIRRMLVTLFAGLFSNFLLNAQTTVVINTGTAGTAAYNQGPIYRSSASSAYDASRFAYLYTQSELAAVGIVPGSMISQVGWTKSNNATGTNGGAAFRIYMKNTSATAFAAATETWANLNSGATKVYENLSFTVPATVSPAYITFDLPTPFLYTGGSLEISTEFDATAISGNPSSAALNWLWSTVPNRIYGSAETTLAATGTLSSTTNSINTLDDRRPFIQIVFTAGASCSGTPTGGTTVASPLSLCFPSEPVSLTVTGSTTGAGLTYQWQSSPDNISWTDIPGATSPGYSAVINSNTWFRRTIICSGPSDNSTPVQVTVNPATYASLPFNESFETPWVNICDTMDAPNASWRNNPAAGYNSWRRNDDETSGDWDTGNGDYTPASSNGSYSARFHTWDAASGTAGLFDVYLNCNTSTPNKRLSFDYINTSGSDSLVIMVSTNGGLTFTRLDSVRVATEWRTRVIDFTSASATTVIRFKGVSDFGTTDIGLDNVTVADIVDCAGAPGVGSALSTTTSACPGIPFTLSANGINTTVYGLSFQWQSSPDNSTWTNIAGATAITHQLSQTVATYYRLVVTCTVSGLSSNSSSIQVGISVPNYTTLPFTESFENTWINGCDVRDIPANYWRNSPVRTDSSWRRNDDGLASGAWTNNNGAYTPAASVGNFSARFHTYQASSSRRGFFDLYVNANTGVPQKRLTFDFINTSGNDSLVVFVSADGGATFSRLDSVRTATAWRSKTIDFTATSATTVIRFRATSDFGTTDIGLDNIAVYDFVDCSGTPDAGTAQTTATVVCNTPFTLSTNGPILQGVTYQWQSSPDNTTWTNIAGATNNNLTTTQAVTTYYRLVVTCTASGLAGNSVSVMVTSPALVSGVFTINNNGTGDFASFTEAYEHIRCGINGQVVFNVTAGVPYNEQLVMQAVPGASSANKIIFNGNGAIITDTITDANNRAIIKLDGADHITLDSLVINAGGDESTEYGWGIHLINSADSNVISRCVINIDTTETSNQFAGIVINSSVTSLTTTGVAQNDYNIIRKNRINGGQMGISMVSNSTVYNSFNTIQGNTIQNFYQYGIYVNGSAYAIIDSNMLSRPTRTTVTTFSGIYFTGLSGLAKVSRNTITNPFGGNPTSTSTFNGIYFTASDPNGGVENIVSNNLIYGLNGSGDVNGLYNSSSDNVWFYHNTISLDGPAPASTATHTTIGFYQTGAAAGIRFKDNIVSITRGGQSLKYAIYFNTAGNDTESDYNNFYLDPTATNTFVGFANTSDHPILANWTASTLLDSNSLSNNPLFTDTLTGNFKPTNAVIDNLGTPVGITDDILGMARGAQPDMGAYEFAPPACIAPPTAGDANVSTTPACENSLVQLAASGYSTGAGQTYQWQVADALAGPYATISSVLTNPAFTITATQTAYYRLAVTCSGITSYSTPVLLTVIPGLPGGNYTIDATQLPSSTNFISFNAAKQAMACGITGPVTFTVETGSGPYLEQLILDSIPGTSQVNTITFLGNGETIKFSSSVSAERAVIKLRGTDYVTFDSLVVDATGPETYGWGIQLMDNADSNTIKNCTIITSTTSTSTNYSGIVINASNTSATGTGAVLSDKNTIQNNTIYGGAYGITSAGNTANPVQFTRIIGNKLYDQYTTAIYINVNNGALVEGNRIERPTRTNGATTVHGIYFTGANTRAVVNANRILNPFGAMPATTSDYIGIMFTSADAQVGAENTVTNNLIYRMNGAGFLYGMQNTGSNYIRYYHNTISIDDISNTATTASRGFYQTTDADGIVFKNNNITISRGGTGAKHGIYMGTSTTQWESDNNNYYLVPVASSHVGYLTSNRTTLADWQTASSQDDVSVSIDPIYADTALGNYIPTIALLDDIGTPVGVLTDIVGATRDLVTPDIGAFEFAIIPCTAPPTPGDAVASPVSGICMGESVVLNLTGNSTGGFQIYRWQRGASAAGPWTYISDTLYIPEFSHELSSQDSYFRAEVTCSGNIAYSTPVQITMNPALLAGDYTIDPANPPSATNFQSFSAAAAALNCGITGSVRFHAVPGTFNEQVRIRKVPGASATSTVTFMSQNGNPASVNLTYNPSDAAFNYILKLDSAQFVTFKNISFTAVNETNGRAIEFAGSAGNDSILNSNIRVPVATTTATTSAAIFGTGVTGSDIVIKGNNILNGSSAIYLVGTAGSSNAFVIDSNRVDSAYQYAIYLSNINSVLVNKNTVQKGGLLNTTTYGIYLTNCDSNYRVLNNNINIASAGTTVYGIYLTGCQSVQVNKGRIASNKVIAGTNNTGNQYGLYVTTTTNNNTVNNVIVANTSGATSYGIYSTGTGGINYHNNSVQSSATSATNNIAAYFSQTSGANGAVNIRNNIFSHTNRGVAMYIVNPRFIFSDYNMFYTAGDTLIQWGTGNIYPTLQDWRDTSYWDFNSIVYQPAFTSASDLMPNLASPDVWAIHGRGVQITGNNVDFNNNTRPETLTAGVPDLGAYEFVPTSTPVLLTATPATPAPNTTQRFMLGTDTVTQITWGATVPTTIEGRRYSGVTPPNLVTGQQHMYFYTDFETTGTAPTGHAVKQYYIDPWRNNIPTEPQIRLGRTNAANSWQTSPSSIVDQWGNTLYEAGLTFLDKFTGLTDGLAAPAPPVVVSSSDSSNRGKKFWVGYGHHQDFGSGNAQEMVLYLGAASTPATVTVRINGTSWVKEYQVPANSVIATDFLPKYGFFDARLTEEGLSERGISIESTEPITAYAHIYGNTNSGATMLMPVGTYGYEYYALTSKQNYAANTYSWAYVVAAYDSTTVEITPSKPTLGGRPAGVPFTVQLKKGEVYQVMGAIISGSDGYDMTGTKFKSIANSNNKCYPIAVFSGSSRTNIGCGTASPTGSGDNIIQQNFPFRAWGRRYLTAPTSQQNTPSATNTNIFKVAVKDPTTVVMRNGTQLTGLIDNLYYQFESNTGDFIEADKPIMLAQIMPSSSSASACGYVGYGDPELIYISPIEQGINNVALYRNTEYNIVAQYLTLIIPTGGIPSLTIDGSSTFSHVYPHPNMPNYSVVVKRWDATNGQTFVHSDSAFTAITYGLGSAESYGYNAGTLVKNLNVFPGITNVYNTSGNTNTYTCAGTPFKMSFLSTVQPNMIEWNVSQVPGLSPNADVIQVNPTSAGSVVINGVTYYEYELPAEYVINSTGTFYVPIFITHPDVEGCNDRMEMSLEIRVIGSPTADFNNTITACYGLPATFTGTGTTVNSVGINSWSWDFDDNGATANTQVATHTYATPGTYDVKLSIIAAEGCIADTVKTVTISDGPDVLFVPDSIGACLNSNVTFNITNPETGVTYNWYVAPTGGTPIHTGTSYTVTNITGPVSFFVAGDQGGCISAVRTEVEATVRPALATPVVVLDSAGANMLRWRWDAVPSATSYEVSIDNGATWTTPSSGATGLTHTISGLQVGQTITLMVRANGGCQPSMSIPVTGVTLTDQVYIPNAFTPNGDGRNDVLRVYSNVIREMRFMVFNQWGEKIFESRDVNTAWDGTFKGKGQPSGVYMYVCDITLTDGTRIQRKGSINLVR